MNCFTSRCASFYIHLMSVCVSFVGSFLVVHHLQKILWNDLNPFFTLPGLVSVPSMATFEGIKRYISNKGNSPSPVSPKQSVILDWVSNEDGSHILTVAVGNKILLLTTVSSELAAATQKANLDARGGSGRPLLSRSSSMGFQQFPDEIR